MMRRILPLLLVLLLGACSTPAPVPDDHYYRLPAMEVQAVGGTPLLEGRLLVTLPKAGGVRRGRKMLYSDDAGHVRFQQYHYHHWETSIPQVLQRRLAGLLTDRGVVEEVLTRPGRDLSYRLESRVLRFERLIDGDRYAAMVELEFELAPNDAAREPILQMGYPVQVTARSSRMEDTVIAFSQAIDEIAGRLRADIEGALDQ